MTEISRTILAKELGNYILTYLEEKTYWEESIMERECARILHQIVEVLNDETLDDFYCLDKVVDVIHAAGLSTSRHDF